MLAGKHSKDGVVAREAPYCVRWCECHRAEPVRLGDVSTRILKLGVVLLQRVPLHKANQLHSEMCEYSTPKPNIGAQAHGSTVVSDCGRRLQSRHGAFARELFSTSLRRMLEYPEYLE